MPSFFLQVVEVAALFLWHVASPEIGSKFEHVLTQHLLSNSSVAMGKAGMPELAGAVLSPTLV